MPNLKTSLLPELTSHFNALDLITQDCVLDELTALHNSAKEKRRAELRAELGLLTDRPLKAKPASKPKYKSLKNPALVWSGRGAVRDWFEVACGFLRFHFLAFS